MQDRASARSGYARMRVRAAVVLCAMALVVVAILAAGAWRNYEVSRAAVPRGPSSADDDSFFTAISNQDEAASLREVTDRENVAGKRARKVKYQPERLRAVKRGANVVKLVLFDDTVVIARFLPASPLRSLRSELSGTVEGDPDGRVQIDASDTGINGEIVFHGRTFRLISLLPGEVTIVEMK